MVKRRARTGAERRPRRLGVFSLAALAILVAGVWMSPAVLVHTRFRDRPLEAAFTGIDGRIASGSARWSWLSGIEYRDVVLADREGRPAVIVPSLVVEKGLLALAADPRSLGPLRLSGVEAVVAVRPGGSSLEDILAPWLARAAGAAGVTAEIELVGGTVEFVDTLRQDAWRVSDLIAAGTLEADGSLAGWTAAGRVRHAGRPGDATSAAAGPAAPPSEDDRPAVRLDRTTIPAAAAAALARAGGWSISAPPPPTAGPRPIAVTTHRLPLGISSVAATRFGSRRLADGLADLRLDVLAGDAGTEVRGRAVVERFAVCASDTLAEEFSLERFELPLDVTVEGNTLSIRELKAISPVLEAEVSGRLPLVAPDPWRWLEQAVGRDCSVAARIDLAQAARGLPGGLAVRPDVELVGGSLDLAAVARADGADRVLEVRLAARDLAAVRHLPAAGPAAADRQLRWSEPLTGWLKGRRGPGGEARLQIEEGRIASEAVEISAAGTPAALQVQWTADLGGLVGDLAELLDLGGLAVAGKARGRLECERAGDGVTAVRLAASLTEFALAPPGRPAWRDDAITVDGEVVGSLSGSLATVAKARGMMTAAGDSLEVSLAGGVIIDTLGLAGAGRPLGLAGAGRPLGLAGAGRGGAVAWIRPAAAAGEVTADCSLLGDLGRWHTRLAAAVPAAAVADLELGGSLSATAAVTPEPAAGADAWRITKAGAEVERFTLQLGGRRVAEPRIVVTAAGVVSPVTGRLDLSSAELLSSSVSVRTGGATWLATPPAGGGPLASLLAGIRGRLQWQADLGRLEDWIVPAPATAAWPVTGRAWGTLDVADTQLGVNLVAEATGAQLMVASRPDRLGEARPVWSEPQASIALELTRPLARTAAGSVAAADRIVIDRLAIESSTVAVAARGGVEELSGRRRGELTGSLAYDWGQLSRLATPWTGGRVRLAGTVNRPFTIRGPLDDLAPEVVASGTAAGAGPADTTLPLPDAWLTAARGGADALGAGITLPGASASGRLAERLAAVSLETSVSWTAADLEGFEVGPGDVAVRLVEGQLAVGPFDLEASGGRLRAAPWWRLAPFPGEVVVPPGRVADRVELSGGLCDRLVARISPLLGHTTDTSGVMTVDTAGARLPLGDAFAGEAAAQVTFEEFTVRPSGGMQPLVNLLGKLQAAIDPRFALGDTPVLLRVRPEPVRLRLAQRRIWHEGLVMDSGQFTVTSRGSVGDDGSLAMLVEVALRADAVGQTPVLATLLRTPIAIPLRGTLARPQFDAGAIDVTVRRILENTAHAVVDEGIGRGLEAIFGRPPAPPVAPSPGQPGPLVLPR